jgi:hypothetical protein
VLLRSQSCVCVCVCVCVLPFQVLNPITDFDETQHVRYYRNCWSDFGGIVDKLQELLKWFCRGSSTNYRNCWSDFGGIVDKLQELLKWFWWDRRQTTGTVEVILVGSSINYKNCWTEFRGIVDKLQELVNWFGGIVDKLQELLNWSWAINTTNSDWNITN